MVILRNIRCVVIVIISSATEVTFALIGCLASPTGNIDNRILFPSLNLVTYLLIQNSWIASGNPTVVQVM